MSPESAPDTSTPPVGVEDPTGGIPMRYDSERGMHIPGDNRGNVINFNPNINQSVGGEVTTSTPRSIPVVEAAPEEPQPLETPLESPAEEPEPVAAEQPVDQNAELLQRLDRMMELMQAQMEIQTQILEQNNRILEMLANQNRPPEPESVPETVEPETVEPEPEPEPAEESQPALEPVAEPEQAPGPEPEPVIEDDLIVEPEDDEPDGQGNTAQGRARRMWAWMGDALAGRHLINYVLARTISAEQQGTRRRKIFNRAAGALAMIGAGAGLYYLISRGMDGGSGGGGSLDQAGQHLDTYNLEHGRGIVNVVLPEKFDLITNANGVSSLIDVDSGNSVLTGSELPRGMFQ
ncbi:hypothetical protein HY379_02865, partial [Candidatus Saccharibacteria bacterium]|nr:hypothetical protein [Candidatus Saccharibacteria bacterium]